MARQDQTEPAEQRAVELTGDTVRLGLAAARGLLRAALEGPAATARSLAVLEAEAARRSMATQAALEGTALMVL